MKLAKILLLWAILVASFTLSTQAQNTLPSGAGGLLGEGK